MAILNHILLAGERVITALANNLYAGYKIAIWIIVINGNNFIAGIFMNLMSWQSDK